MNITPHSSIGCSPFEAGHGLPAQSVAHARLLAQQTLADGVRGIDLDVDYTTTTPSLAKHSKATYGDRLAQIQKAVFLRTWALPTGEATTEDPKSSRKRNNLWTGLIPLRFLCQNIGATG